MKSYINTPELSKLTSLVQNGNVVAFVGSGFSMREYPSWENLVRTLCGSCDVDFESERPNNDLMELAEMARENNEDAYCRTLSSIFGNENVSVPRAYNYLVNTQFQGYVTINFDPLLAEAGRGIKKAKSICSFRDGTDITLLNRDSIFYIHGYVEFGGDVGPNDLILCKSDFEKHYAGAKPRLRSFLEPLFTYRSVVFLGCGLTEDALRKILVLCDDIRKDFIEEGQKGVPDQYILLPSIIKHNDEGKIRDYKAEEIANKEYQDYGLIVIRYDRESEDDFMPITKIIEEWSGLPVPVVISPFNPPELSL